MLGAADVVVYAGTYLDAEVLGHCREGVRLVDTQDLDLDVPAFAATVDEGPFLPDDAVERTRDRDGFRAGHRDSSRPYPLRSGAHDQVGPPEATVTPT